MRLTWDGVAPGVGQDVGNGLGALAEPGDCTAVDNQGVDIDASDAFLGDREVSNEGGFIDEGRGQSFLRGPPGSLTHLVDEFGRHPHGVGHEERYHVATSPLSEQFSELFLVVLRDGWTTAFDNIGWLPESQLFDVGGQTPGGGVQGEDSTA